ncbi:pyridine nucleotide-disulfide oxidoreductase [Sinomonas cellulolyticus]|uniref:FAD-dependent oxidoreductase n=1 Tax=Sinomonas cellulolyticus TaxID=2801916 RepID=A0ABS1JXT8_9MICC|nr:MULTISPECIES: FAD-dependent oxidoreductase [Sinomonas]MBL0704194.1 FAD-dependent oxidoreductase [Sinomonas cellulolyticus]GHG58205.1 pyridine nucleotide-disulfide oxidoreductase [Sinomonas sp. KCTC 49339]
MDVLEFDDVFIGWGKGGKTLAGVLGRAGRRVAMVEQSEAMYGGTCINIGCVPTKALVYASHLSHDGGDAAHYTDSIERKDELTAALRSTNFSMLDSIDSVTAITARAEFVGPKRVRLTAGSEEKELTAERFYISTGSLPVVPDLPGLSEGGQVLDPRVHVSTDLISERNLPRRLLIVGGGYIAYEFASMYAGFGSEVTMVDRSPIPLRHEDRDVAEAVASVLAGDGVRFLQGARVAGAEGGAATHDGAPSPLRVRIASASGQLATVEADAVLLALGRAPATEGLGLDKAGVEIDGRGAVVVDEYLRTTAPDVWALGDVNGGPQHTYVSLDDHRIVLAQVLGGPHRTTTDRTTIPTTTFVTPPFSRVGLTEEQAREQAAERGWDVGVASKEVAKIAAMPRPKTVRDPRGLIKVVVDKKSGTILGTTLFCVDSQEVINLISFAMDHGLPYTALRDRMYTHPSSSEAFNEVLGAIS